MITRKPSKIMDSVVNSSHEEHLNVTKAIRDDAPITNLTSCVKSINFESDGDGSYILRKPLVKKASLNSSNQILLSNKTDILTISGNSLTITNAQKIMLRFYDNKLVLHEYTYTTSLPVSWLTITKAYNTSDYTLFSSIISHFLFLSNVDYENNAIEGLGDLQQTAVIDWKWLLLNDIWSPDSHFSGTSSIGDSLKRFIKVYKHESDSDTYVFEIINPEFNSITSGLDVGNAQTLDINLLLENPYSIRDLYNYGYISTTKIIPYVFNKDDSERDINDIYNNFKVWQLTERPASKYKGSDFNDGFKILVSTNPNSFNKRYLILKAFLTTGITGSKYYCRWEQSKDDGITWEDCNAFITRFEGSLVSKKVSDVSSKDFEKMLYEESLEKASTYLVDKQVVLLNTTSNGYSFKDSLAARPDILILENPNLSYKYRFIIYLDTEKEPPTPSNVTKTEILSSFINADHGFIGSSEEIAYQTHQKDALSAPSIKNNCLVLYSGPLKNDLEHDGNRVPLGNTLDIKVAEGVENARITNIAVTFGPSSYNTTSEKFENLGAFIGIGCNLNAGTLEDLQYGGEGEILNYEDYYGVQDEDWANADIREFFPAIIWDRPQSHQRGGYIIMNPEEVWCGANSSKTYNVSTYSESVDNQYIILANLNNCCANDGPDCTEDFVTYSGKQASEISEDTLDEMLIKSITVEYTIEQQIIFTSVYLISSTGVFSIAYSDTTKLIEDVTLERERLFSGEMFYNEAQKQLLIFKDNFIYISGTNSAIIKLMSALEFPDPVSKIVPWRSYLLIFTPKSIFLAKYDNAADTYSLKILSNSTGVPLKDANTIVPILNSVYFKSGTKIYKLVPNLYYASDDILNIHQISVGVNTILEDIVNSYSEGINFSYADSDVYMLFMPIASINSTYCICYDFVKQIWTLQKYPILLSDVEKLSISEIYLKSSSALYYFKEKLTTLLSKGLETYCTQEDLDISDYNIKSIIHSIPYADYPTLTPLDLISSYINQTDIHLQVVPITYEIDFGQKSSNYTMDKQFLETKLVLATLSSKDNFPFSLDISTDGVSRELHWDANTDGAIWKNTLEDYGVLNTGFNPDGADYNGIFRQLIVKYSGKGKSIRHVISGNSKSLFKFYSMSVRARILPKKR